MIEKLVKYQEEDSKLWKIEREIASSEERKKANHAKKILDSILEYLDKLEYRSGEVFGSYSGCSGQLEELKREQAEYKDIDTSKCDESELDYVAKKAQVLFDKIIDLAITVNRLKDEMVSLNAQYNKLKKQFSEAKTQYNDYRAQYNELKNSKAEEMNAIQAELKKIEKQIDPTAMAKYKAKRQDKVFPIMFEYKGGHCPNCNTEFCIAEENMLKKNGIIECDNCRCIVYMLEH